ncbi:C25 family cysteine peptidase, partial [Candidatus Marinimicrobia bacterium]|nr:C25 family cysteine peptidase [Candidatus Neomarinimicrobiota bacterium]
NQIVYHDNVEILINEYPTEETREHSNMKISRIFEDFYEQLVINYEPSNRDEDYQEPSILYICGGASIDNSYVQELIDWRHRTGYIVNAVSTDEIGSGSSAVKNYIQSVYDQSDNPPEIVGLIGDTGGNYSIGYYTENWSGYGGAGDFPYTQLDGSDLFPEIIIGRISVNSSSDLNNVINKTLAYEKASYISQVGTDWYETSSLIGDPSSSGQSTIITNQYIEDVMKTYQFQNINTNYGIGNYASWMESQLEDGSLYMNYRGYIGVSGFSSSNINGANNYYKTPFATFLTCGTGDFNYTSFSEDIFRAGSVSNPKGAVAAVGTATSGTHTMFNNIVAMGIYDGIFSKNMKHAGTVVTNGRLSLLSTYPDDPSERVSIFSHWNNLIGDPALVLWTDTPKVISANFINSVSYGTNFIDISIQDEFGSSVEGALITLLKGDDEIFISSLTDISGNSTIKLDYESIGEVHLTVTKKNCIPIEESFNIVIDETSVNVQHDSIQILDNDNGNGDGIANPGEEFDLIIPLKNYGFSTATNIVANLSTSSDLVSILNNQNIYGDIESEETSTGNLFYSLLLDEQLTSSDDLSLLLEINDGSNIWGSIININIQAGMIVLNDLDIINGSTLNPGQQKEIKIYLENQGDVVLEDVQITLLNSGYFVDIVSGLGFFGDIYPGQIIGSNNQSSLIVQVDQNTINGATIHINANITSSNGYSRDIIITEYAGEATIMDPLGPDSHGYYIYDSNDLDYNLAPIYDWIEIDQDLGGNGELLPLSDGGNGNGISNSSITLDLPFEFKFYGINYSQIVVNTNGWISFGNTEITSFRNYPLPGAGGPSPMIAAFWDDLKTTSSAEIYKLNFENYYVIEWSEMRTNNNNSSETFQIILYDNTYLTPTGDNEIKIQYKDFNNTSTGSYGGWGTPIHGAYCTVGIENHLGTVGLQYTFNNSYPNASMPLENESAIFITTRNPIQTLLGDANQDEEINVLDVIVTVNHITNIELLDSMGAYIADLDGNGSINILDVIIIINLILQG